jgi:thioredoxin-related protein
VKNLPTAYSRLLQPLAIAIALFALSSLFYAGENSNLKWRDFNDGIAEAKKTNKKILIDVYTDWCGWCKRMDSQTYADKQVAKYLGERYVLVKLNAESAKKIFYNDKQYTEREFSAAFGITGYPATLFLKSNGEAITIYPGFADAKRFMDVASFIAEDHYLTKKFDEYVSSKK